MFVFTLGGNLEWISFFSPAPPAVSMLSVDGSSRCARAGPVYVVNVCQIQRVNENVILQSDKGASISPLIAPTPSVPIRSSDPFPVVRLVDRAAATATPAATAGIARQFCKGSIGGASGRKC